MQNTKSYTSVVLDYGNVSNWLIYTIETKVLETLSTM